MTLIQLLSAANDPAEPDIDYTYWNSKEGLKNISTFADGIGPEKSQLVVFNKQTGELKPSQLYHDAKELDLLMHPYTFRIDQLPAFVSNYQELLKIYIDDLRVDGLFSDFPDLTLNYIENSGVLIKFNSILAVIILTVSLINNF